MAARIVPCPSRAELARFLDRLPVTARGSRWTPGRAPSLPAASSGFLRRARKLKSTRDELLRAALRRSARDPQDPLLRTHKLRAISSDDWAFRVEDDLRVLFRWEGDACFLVALGTHDEVY